VFRSSAFLLFMASLFLSAASAAERPTRWRAVWHVSEALLAGANGADIASSWGKSEANPLVRTGPRFNSGSLAIKLGVAAGTLLAQHYIVRRSPNLTPFFASADLAAAAALSVTAAHNMGVAR